MSHLSDLKSSSAMAAQALHDARQKLDYNHILADAKSRDQLAEYRYRELEAVQGLRVREAQEYQWKFDKLMEDLRERKLQKAQSKFSPYVGGNPLPGSGGVSGRWGMTQEELEEAIEKLTRKTSEKKEEKKPEDTEPLKRLLGGIL